MEIKEFAVFDSNNELAGFLNCPELADDLALGLEPSPGAGLADLLGKIKAEHYGGKDFMPGLIESMRAAGYLLYPIEEFQKSLLLHLNHPKYKPIRDNALGDILSFSKQQSDDFLKDISEIDQLIAQIK